MAKPRVRMTMEVSYQPRAICIANIAGDGQPEQQCPWSMPYSQATKQAARDHTAATGHTTQTIRETWSEYERDDG
jgi:hypothetical protein